ncbi:hypothetical protein CALVIDRAFT_564984 [Calocera viscosa TUFC12733]|uniref:Mso1 N-terminal domain-containing protein n=1 Tax=Calocera viscosa (strain TUFC12733) TaxID=1330018 RepID=A0A167L0B7_CALVF|nr:hypothetical protein CALVIDRAFT_564984 [Calocera viscosa TUFC12733]
MPSGRGIGIPALPAEYTRGRTGENSSSRLSAVSRRSRSHGRPALSHARSNSSTSSEASSSSSLFDRPGRAGSIAGSETSDDSRSIISVNSSKSGKGLKNRPSGLSLRSRTQSQTRIVMEEEEVEIIPPVPPLPATATLTRQPTYGPTLWERLVASATVTAKEWNFYGEGEDEYDEPNTPGGETHLTAVLKTYYIDRARSKNDLPMWLFDGRERNVNTPLYSAGPQYLSPLQTPRTGTATASTVVPGTATSVASNQSLRDLYEEYAQSPATDSVKVRSPTPATRAQNRLRELRNAKRMGNLAVVDASNHATMRPLLSAGLASRPKSQRLPAGPKTGRI